MFQCQLSKIVLIVLQRQTGFVHISVQWGNGHEVSLLANHPSQKNAGANSTSLLPHHSNIQLKIPTRITLTTA